MSEERSFAARRILVAIDASAASLDALAAAASLAVRLGASLDGLFVEDQDLLRLSALPFGHIVRTPGGEPERLDPGAAETSLRALAARAREALERAASRHQLACSFRVARGRVVPEVLAAAAAADLVVLGASSHGPRARSALGTTARAAAERAPTSVLLLPRGARVEGAVVAVDDDTAAGARTVAAARLLAPADRPIAVIHVAGPTAEPLADAIAELSPALAAIPVAAPTGREIAERVLAEGIAVLLVR